MNANITIRQLEVFIAITNFSHLTKAAESLYISQAAASLSLAELENQLGCKLFDRIGGRMHLNSQGQRLYDRARDILDRFQDLPSAVARDKNLSGHLRIGSSCTIGNYILPQIISGFVLDYPHSQLSLSITNTDNAVRQILTNEVDVAFIEGDCDDKMISREFWMEECLVFIAPPSSPLLKSSLSLAALKDQNWILRNRGSNTRIIFDEVMKDHLDQIAIRLELEHTQAVINAVIAGLGISCVSRIAVQSDLLNGKLAKLNLRLPQMRRGMHIVTHRKKYIGALLQKFIDYCRQSTGQFSCLDKGLYPYCDCRTEGKSSPGNGDGG